MRSIKIIYFISKEFRLLRQNYHFYFREDVIHAMFVFYVLYLHKNKNMPRYHKLGKIPHKRHTTFRKEDGNIHYEELFGTIGFDGM